MMLSIEYFKLNVIGNIYESKEQRTLGINNV